MVEVDGVGCVERAVGREGDLQGAELRVAGESGYGPVQPSGSEVGRTARIADGRRAEGAVREELQRGGDGRGAVQGLDREAKGHDPQRIVAADLGVYRNQHGLPGRSARI